MCFQYENAFNPKHLANWELPHPYREVIILYQQIVYLLINDV